MARVSRPLRGEIHQPHGRCSGVGGGDGLLGSVHGNIQERAARRVGWAMQSEGYPLFREPYTVR